MSEGFRRIAIVNRGEPAVRLIRAVRELEAERSEGLRTIALYTDADRNSLYVRDANEAFALGSALFRDEHDGRTKSRYLDYAGLERALRETGAEAAWVGWGFVAEHARFAELCRDLGVVFIGPDPEVMRKLGDKIGSKLLAEAAGVPVAPWSGGPVTSLEEASACADRLGFPLMVKATAGGGGRGIRRVRRADELGAAFESAREEALKAFGDDTVFLETLLEKARHVEVQVVCDGHGGTWALGVRDCSVQRRNQKVIEETPSPALDDGQHKMLCDAAARLVEEAGYRNAGTVEFLYDCRERRFSFMEVNARLQVEHPVTEQVTGVDLVKLQIHVARGGRLEGAAPEPRGHAIEVRVNAEDPEREFAPAPGRIDLFRPPSGPGIRVDAGVVEGQQIAAEFDSMVAKVIAHGCDRVEALGRLERALGEMRFAVADGATNKGFLLGLLRRPEVREGRADNAWLDDLAARGEHLPQGNPAVALVLGAIEAYEAGFARERARFLASAARGRPRWHDRVGRDVELRTRGETYQLKVFQLGPGEYRVHAEGRGVQARVESLTRFERRLHIGGRSYDVVSTGEALERVVEIDGIPHRLSRDEAGVVRAPSPAVVLSMAVAVGDEVAEGDLVAVLEAMKTELRVAAPCAGRVRKVVAATHAQVDMGEPLVELELIQRHDATKRGERVVLDMHGDSAGLDAAARVRAALSELERLMLGFDVDPTAASGIVDEWHAVAGQLPADDAELARAEDGVLDAFADVAGLFRGRLAGEDADAGSSQELLHTFLRALDAEGAGLPEGFLAKLGRSLARYGVASLARTQALEEALLRLCMAHGRMDDQAGAVRRILERRLEQPVSAAAHTGAAHRERLDRIIAATRVGHPAVSDLAREVRYRSVDRPLLQAVRDAAYADAEEHLAALAAGAGPEAHVRALVECHEPLVNLLSARFARAEGPLRERMLEALTRRYYRTRALESLETRSVAGLSMVTAAYRHEGARIEVIAVAAEWADLPSGLEAIRPLVDAVPADLDVMLDLYLWQEGPHQDPDTAVAELRSHVVAAGFTRPLRRVVAAVAAPGYGPGMSSMQHFTLRPREGGDFAEERVYRGIHPMMAKRLQLWRTGHFEIERLPSTEDVYLFHGTARTNPRDERLFVFAEVRDLTPVRAADGRVERLPNLEMMLMEALAAIRRIQSHRTQRTRLHWNRVLLYLWPELELDDAEIRRLMRRLAPATADLGVEEVVLRARRRDPRTGELRVQILELHSPAGPGTSFSVSEEGAEPIQPLSEYDQKVLRMRQRGLVYPYEIAAMLAPASAAAGGAFPPGSFQEYDLGDAESLVPVQREPGQNISNLVVGIVTNITERHPEGMARVLLMGDPSQEMGSFAEPECRRIIGAIDLAAQRGIPLEWIAVSAGAKIAMDSGTENLDWTAAALRRLIEFTQEGGEVNVIAAGVNVGGQSYWNAEAAMLMHTRGVLIMTDEASMVLTGKRALDYSGGVSAEDNRGIGGYDRIMGVNGEAQYWATDIGDACRILLSHYEHGYVQPGERFPRGAPTSDPPDRDICLSPHESDEESFATVGEIFRDETNPGRRRPFDIRSVMRAVIDADRPPLERWRDMREAEMAVVWDAHLGGQPVCLIGFESRPIRRLGAVPTDGPEAWTAGTLFPLSSKKVARAINSATGNRPLVVLANLSGFDGSPESMRRLQLEYGAEIGRAVVNFRGPIAFCVISRYHGGAYVVFSQRLNENLEVAALEGSYASVIGGAPAAAVVFSRDVDRRTREDERVASLDAEIAAASKDSRGRLGAQRHDVAAEVHSEKLGEVAAEFEEIHSVERARRVGSLHEILPPARLRPYLIDAVKRGMQRELERWERSRRRREDGA